MPGLNLPDYMAKYAQRARRRLLELIMRTKVVAKGYEDLANCIELWEKVKDDMKPPEEASHLFLMMFLLVVSRLCCPKKS